MNKNPISGSVVRNDLIGLDFTEAQWNEANNLALENDNLIYYGAFEKAQAVREKYEALVSSLRGEK